MRIYILAPVSVCPLSISAMIISIPKVCSQATSNDCFVPSHYPQPLSPATARPSPTAYSDLSDTGPLACHHCTCSALSSCPVPTELDPAHRPPLFTLSLCLQAVCVVCPGSIRLAAAPARPTAPHGESPGNLLFPHADSCARWWQRRKVHVTAFISVGTKCDVGTCCNTSFEKCRSRCTKSIFQEKLAWRVIKHGCRGENAKICPKEKKDRISLTSPIFEKVQGGPSTRCYRWLLVTARK